MEKLEEAGFIGIADYLEDWVESLLPEFTTVLVDELLEQYCLPVPL